MTYQILLYFPNLDSYDYSEVVIDQPGDVFVGVQAAIDARCLEKHSLTYEVCAVMKKVV